MAEEPPRWLDRNALAVHISIRVDEVAKLRRAGELPPPSYHFGPKPPRWNCLAVDASLEDHAARSASKSAEEAVHAVVEKIRRDDKLEGGPGLRRRGP